MSTRLLTLAATWHTEATRRRAMSTNDAIADALDYCAKELASEVRDVTEADTELSAEAYADLHGVSAATVRRWCMSGAITANKVGRGWTIRRGEPAPTFRLSA